jgi:hypothetical protein
VEHPPQSFRLPVAARDLDPVIAKAATMKAAGWSREKIIGQLVCGWTEDERTKVGVN